MNAEQYLITHLNSTQAQEILRAPACGEVPARRPKRFITVERVGGQSGRVIEQPLFAVQIWAESRAKAADLATLTATVLQDMVALPEVGLANVNSVYNFPDPDSKQSRYQITFSCVLHF